MYNWKRFWVLTTENIRLDYGGFLYDPESEYGRFTNPDVAPFSAICHTNCLILLGEPGIGKTTATKEAYDQVSNQVSKSGDTALWLNLGDYDSDKSLCDTIFCNTTFINWLNGTHKLHLFLDSLDEGLLSIKILIKILKREIENLPCERLYLRITCRTSVWLESSSLEQMLTEKWKKTNTRIYELAPLRRIDVIEAAQINSINSDNFLQEILDREVSPLAIKPVTLKLLLGIYSKNKQFPLSQKELYEQGCLQLCEELNQERRESGFRGKLNSSQRLILVGRIAAVMIFSNRAAIWTSPELADMPNSDIALRDFCVGKENINQQEFIIDEDSIREVLSVTGLFSSRGINRMGFAHQTYAEFLAAWYLTKHEIPLVQIMSLIVSPEDPERKLLSQLHEVAAWLASMRSDVIQEIIKTDPDILLRGDIPTVEKIREAIVNSLLIHYDSGKLLNQDWSNYRRYKKLKHSRLAEQLRPYIQDSNKQFEARYEAIDIAEACEIYELQEDLVNLALSSSQPIELRVNAAKSVSLISDLNTKLKLKPLAIGKLQEDEEDQLKGYSLKAVWPENLTASELFNAITPPKRRNYVGGYDTFLSNEIVAKLQPTDLVIALNWVEQQGLRCFGHSFEKLADEIIFKAWEHFDIAGVAEKFANIALLQWRECQSLITHSDSIKQQFVLQLFDSDEKRRELLEKVILIAIDTGEETTNLVSLITENILLEKDILWMIEKLKITESTQEQQIWAQLIKWSYNHQNAKQIDAIITASLVNDILFNQFKSNLEGIELNSDEAANMKAFYQRTQERRSRGQETLFLEPPPKERVLLCLEQLESGDLSSWWRLNMEMSLKSDNIYYDKEYESDLTKLPGWQEAEITTRNKIINGAKKYVKEQNQVDYSWIGTNNLNKAALAGCRALQLLLKESPDFISHISADIWQRWASVIVAFPISHEIENDYLDLVKLAYLNAPDEVINTLMLIINKQNDKGLYLSIINKFDKCWDERLKSAFLEKVRDKALQPQCMSQLLEELLKHNSNEAREFAKSFIIFPLPSIEEEREKIIAVSKVLVENSDPISWSVIWSAVQQNTEYGHEVFEGVANRYSHGINLNITEEQLSDLYIWLVQQYPHNEDPVFEGVHFVTDRESVGTFRDSVLNQLKERGTPQACAEIQRISQNFPELKWLKRTLLLAQNNRRRNAWKPPEPSEIMQLINSKEKRLIQDGNELLNTLLESLQQLQVELQGQTPAVIDLWNEIKWGQIRSLADSLVKYLKNQFGLNKSAKIDIWKGINWRKITDSVYIPKDENRFSDYIARYLKNNLEQRGVIVNREVEIRRGERTDIQVDAVRKKPNGEVYDSVTVIIEAKGCWNNELNVAMETQLVNRYLKDNTCQHGIYLVGWFNCEQWDNSDSRKNKAPKISIDDARDNFEKQAENLSQSDIQVKAIILDATLR